MRLDDRLRTERGDLNRLPFVHCNRVQAWLAANFFVYRIGCRVSTVSEAAAVSLPESGQRSGELAEMLMGVIGAPSSIMT